MQLILIEKKLEPRFGPDFNFFSLCFDDRYIFGPSIKMVMMVSIQDWILFNVTVGGRAVAVNHHARL